MEFIILQGPKDISFNIRTETYYACIYLCTHVSYYDISSRDLLLSTIWFLIDEVLNIFSYNTRPLTFTFQPVLRVGKKGDVEVNMMKPLTHKSLKSSGNTE